MFELQPLSSLFASPKTLSSILVSSYTSGWDFHGTHVHNDRLDPGRLFRISLSSGWFLLRGFRGHSVFSIFFLLSIR